MRCVITRFVCTPFDLSFSSSCWLFENPFRIKGNEYSIYCFHVCHSFFSTKFDIFSLLLSCSHPNSISRSLFFFSLSASPSRSLFFSFSSSSSTHERITLIFFCICCRIHSLVPTCFSYHQRHTHTLFNSYTIDYMQYQIRFISHIANHEGYVWFYSANFFLYSQ